MGVFNFGLGGGSTQQLHNVGHKPGIFVSFAGVLHSFGQSCEHVVHHGGAILFGYAT